MTFRHSTMLGITAPLFVGTALADIKIGFIRDLSSDTGLSILRGAEIAIGETDATGSTSGERFVLVNINTGGDIAEDVKVYEYLAETEEVGFIISGPVDDVSLGWLSRMQESQISTLDTWTPYIGIIDMIIEDLETMVPHFVSITSDEALATLYINFGADVLKREMGWDSVVTLAEDIAFGEIITSLVTEVLDPVAGIGTKKVITYDVGTVDPAPLSPKAQASGMDPICQVSSVNP